MLLTIETPAPTQPIRKIRRRLWLILATGVAIVALSVGVALLLARAEPRYWRVIDVSDRAIAQTAEQIESHITTQSTLAREPDEIWTLELTAEQANAWLAARLPRWLVNQGVDAQAIDAVPHAMVHVARDRVELAAELKLSDPLTQILRLVYVPRIVEGQPVRLELTAMYAGRLRVPLATVVEQVQSHLGGRDAEDAAEVIATLRSIELVLRLEDGRRVTATNLILTDNRAVLTCRTRLK